MRSLPPSLAPGDKSPEEMERDIAYFVSWCIEEYKKVIGKGGADTMQLLDQYGILQYLSDNYEVLHTQGRQWLMEEIDEQLIKRNFPHEAFPRK